MDRDEPPEGLQLFANPGEGLEREGGTGPAGEAAAQRLQAAPVLVRELQQLGGVPADLAALASVIVATLARNGCPWSSHS